MEIVRFKPVYLRDIVEWLLARDLPISLVDDLPKTGFIALSDNRKPIAAGFLREVEGNYGIADSYVTDPRADSGERHSAMDRVVEAVITEAKARNMKMILATSHDLNTISRAQRHGYEKQDHTVLTLDLRKKAE